MLTLSDNATASSVCCLNDRVLRYAATRPDVNPLCSFLAPSGFSAFSRCRVDLRVDDDRIIASPHIRGLVTAYHFAACTDDRAGRMGLNLYAADWHDQICDGCEQSHIPPAQRHPEARRNRLNSSYCAFAVMRGFAELHPPAPGQARQSAKGQSPVCAQGRQS